MISEGLSVLLYQLIRPYQGCGALPMANTGRVPRRPKQPDCFFHAGNRPGALPSFASWHILIRHKAEHLCSQSRSRLIDPGFPMFVSVIMTALASGLPCLFTAWLNAQAVRYSKSAVV